jgi:murein DD-endopeptidase MepM/ murein hydrolase activator NlpD
MAPDWGRTRDCYGWGEPVHAALGGEVVDAVDGVPECQWVHVVRASWAALGTALTFRSTGPSVDVRRLSGNHVIIQSAEVVALYAHLVSAALALPQAERVFADDVIGRVAIPATRPPATSTSSPELAFESVCNGCSTAWKAMIVPNRT